MKIEREEIQKELVALRRSKAETIDQYSLLITDDQTGDTLHRRSLELPSRMSPGEYSVKIVQTTPDGAPTVVNEYQMLVEAPPAPPAPEPKQVIDTDRPEMSELMRMIAQQGAEMRELVGRLMDDREKLVDKIIDQTIELANEKVSLFKQNNQVLTEQFSEMAKTITKAIPTEVRNAQPVDVSAERRADLQEKWLGFGEKFISTLPGVIDRIVEFRAGGGAAP